MDYGFGARPTLSVADVYPSLVQGGEPPKTQQMSGPQPQGGPQAHHVLLGVLVVLVAIRVVYEVAGE